MQNRLISRAIPQEMGLFRLSAQVLRIVYGQELCYTKGTNLLSLDVERIDLQGRQKDVNWNPYKSPKGRIDQRGPAGRINFLNTFFYVL